MKSENQKLSSPKLKGLEKDLAKIEKAEAYLEKEKKLQKILQKEVCKLQVLEL